MNNKDLILMSLVNLLRRKTRTILTISGVTIGTCSIVIMLSLSIAMEQNFRDQLSKMGSLNIIEVYPFYEMYDETGRSFNNNSQKLYLDDKTVAILEKIPSVEAVLAQKNSYFKIGIGRMVASMQVVGVNPDKMEAFGFRAEEGRLLSNSDKTELVFGASTPYTFYNPRLRDQGRGGMVIMRGSWGMMGAEEGEREPPPVNVVNDKMILTSDYNYGERYRGEPEEKPPPLHEVRGIGVLSMNNDEKDYSAYMNITVLEKILAEDSRATGNQNNSRGQNTRQDKYDNLKVKCADIDLVASVRDQIKGLGLQTFSLTDMLESMQETTRMISIFLGGIGAISLLVAAIGITNTMIMSIYERTKEIGVIKVIGADIADIKKMFLMEAGMIGFLGGLTGLVLSYVISFGLNNVVTDFIGMSPDSAGISIIPLYLAVSAIGFATLIGMVAGYTPARRAMKLSALDAIRSE